MTSEDISTLMAASAKDRKAAFEEGRRAGLEEAAKLAKAGPDLPDRAHLRQSDFAKLSEEIQGLAKISPRKKEKSDD